MTGYEAKKFSGFGDKCWYASDGYNDEWLVWIENGITCAQSISGEVWREAHPDKHSAAPMQEWSDSYDFQEPFSLLDLSRYSVICCAECDKPSFNDYLCKQCREIE